MWETIKCKRCGAEVGAPGYGRGGGLCGDCERRETHPIVAFTTNPGNPNMPNLTIEELREVFIRLNALRSRADHLGHSCTLATYVIHEVGEIEIILDPSLARQSILERHDA